MKRVHIKRLRFTLHLPTDMCWPNLANYETYSY